MDGNGRSRSDSRWANEPLLTCTGGGAYEMEEACDRLSMSSRPLGATILGGALWSLWWLVVSDDEGDAAVSCWVGGVDGRCRRSGKGKRLRVGTQPSHSYKSGGDPR